MQSVRPRKLLEEAKYLITTSQLLQNEHLDVQDNWLDHPDTIAGCLENPNGE